jgi:hypothetical protein
MFRTNDFSECGEPVEPQAQDERDYPSYEEGNGKTEGDFAG